MPEDVVQDIPVPWNGVRVSLLTLFVGFFISANGYFWLRDSAPDVVPELLSNTGSVMGYALGATALGVAASLAVLVLFLAAFTQLGRLDPEEASVRVGREKLRLPSCLVGTFKGTWVPLSEVRSVRVEYDPLRVNPDAGATNELAHAWRMFLAVGGSAPIEVRSTSLVATLAAALKGRGVNVELVAVPYARRRGLVIMGGLVAALLAVLAHGDLFIFRSPQARAGLALCLAQGGLSASAVRLDLNGWFLGEQRGGLALWRDLEGDILAVAVDREPKPEVTPEGLREWCADVTEAKGQRLERFEVAEAGGVRGVFSCVSGLKSLTTGRACYAARFWILRRSFSLGLQVITSDVASTRPADEAEDPALRERLFLRASTRLRQVLNCMRLSEAVLAAPAWSGLLEPGSPPVTSNVAQVELPAVVAILGDTTRLALLDAIARAMGSTVTNADALRRTSFAVDGRIVEVCAAGDDGLVGHAALAWRADVALVAVDVTSGVTPVHREHVIVARQMRAPMVALALTTAVSPAAPASPEPVLNELRQLLDAYRCNGAAAPLLLADEHAAVPSSPDAPRGPRAMAAWMATVPPRQPPLPAIQARQVALDAYVLTNPEGFTPTTAVGLDDGPVTVIVAGRFLAGTLRCLGPMPPGQVGKLEFSLESADSLALGARMVVLRDGHVAALAAATSLQ